MMKCFVTAIDGNKVEPIEYEIDRTYPNSDGASIFDQQKKIPDYNLQNFYTISCGDILYDIDCVGWSILTVSERKAQLRERNPTFEVLPSLSVNDPDASHRIVGTSEKFGSGILGYHARDSLSQVLQYIQTIDPEAKVRVEPHNPILNGAALRSTDVEWIVNNDNELGVKIGDQFIFMYKGESFMYGDGNSHVNQYRLVGKREFGEDGPKTTAVCAEATDWMKMDHQYNNNEMIYRN